MKQKPSYARPATAAIAAALAILSTPVMAQNSAAGGAIDPVLAPIMPPPVESQIRAEPAPVKPTPSPVTIAPVSPPRIATVTEEASAPPVVARPAATENARTVRQPSTRIATATRSESTVTANPAPTIGTDGLTEAEMLPTAPVAADEPIQTGRSTPAPSPRFALGEEEQIALAALAGLLGLGAIGGTLVARRRRKSVADAPAAATTERAVEPEPMAAPAIVTAETARPARKAIPLGESRVQPAANGSLTDQIDYTKPAGYYESAVDQAPSPINPFLTRRKRIGRARFLDHQLELAEDRQLAAKGSDDFATRLRRPALV